MAFGWPKKKVLKRLENSRFMGIYPSIHTSIHPSIYIYIYKHQILPDYKGLKLKLKVASSNSSNIWCLHPFFVDIFPLGVQKVIENHPNSIASCGSGCPWVPQNDHSIGIQWGLVQKGTQLLIQKSPQNFGTSESQCSSFSGRFLQTTKRSP